MNKLRVKQSRDDESQFETKRWLGSKKCRKQTPIIFQKKCGSVFFNFLIGGTVWSQITIRRRATSLRVKFSKKTYFFILPAPTQNRSKTPSIVYRWKAYIISEKMYISESQVWSLGASKQPLNKKFSEKLAKNIGGQTCLYPPNPPFLGSKGEKRHFFMKLIQF